MKNYIAVLGLLSAVIVPASASGQTGEDIDLAEYKTVAVQPIIGASNFPGLFESQMAAQASMLKFSPEQISAAKTASEAHVDGGAAGFGFAGKAKLNDTLLLMTSSSIAMLPTMMAVDPAGAKQRLGAFEASVGTLEGKVDAKVVQTLALAVKAASLGDFQNTTKATLLAIGASTMAISKGNERAHGYMAAGIYGGLATLWAANGKTNKAYAELAGPLIMLLEKDAAMGGADRAVAAQLKVIAAQLAGPKPDLKTVMTAVAKMMAVKPDK